MQQDLPEADVCLFLEGTYPYVSGGVSSWAHQLILSKPHLTFFLVSLLPPEEKRTFRYDLPKNIVGHSHVVLQQPPKGSVNLSKKERKELSFNLEMPLLNLLHKPSLKLLEQILDILYRYPGLGREVLLNSEEAWQMVVRIYRSTMGEESFLNFFWSWRSLLSGLYSVLLAPLPPAKVYHSFCTGFAGLFLARASVETGKPCIITEHGIYTNERHIEILGANWLCDRKAMSLNLDKKRYERNLKDLWIDSFTSYSKLCYEAADPIITLYEGNQSLQIAEGADPSKTRIIPNGIDVEKFSKICKKKGHPPTVALIGRVVPIKDVKTFIHAVSILTKKIPNLRALILGPFDEDVEYFEECEKLVEKEGLQKIITFTGKVNITTYLEEIDVIALTSLSEAQPLVILESGACGIPSVTTKVGACQEMILGRGDEDPFLGEGGIVCPLANPLATAEALQRLLTDVKFSMSCGEVIRKRVAKYYDVKQQHAAYDELYKQLISREVMV